MYKIKSACTVADDHQVLVANETTYGKACIDLTGIKIAVGDRQGTYIHVCLQGEF